MVEQIKIYTDKAPCDGQAERMNKKAAKRSYNEVEAARMRYGRTLCTKAQAQRNTYSKISERTS